MIGSCKTCEAYRAEVMYLREQNKELSAKIVAMADPMLQERHTRLELALLQAKRAPAGPTGPQRMGIQELARRNPDMPSKQDQEDANQVVNIDRGRLEETFRVPKDKRQP